MRRLQPPDLGTARRNLDRTVEFAKNEARRGAVATGAPNPSRFAPDRQVGENTIGIHPVDFFVKVGELRGEPRLISMILIAPWRGRQKSSTLNKP